MVRFLLNLLSLINFFFFQAEDGIRDYKVTGVQTCALPISFNTISVSGIIAMTEGRNPVHVWKECYLWAFPYYLLGALIACGVSAVNRLIGWQFGLLAFPIVYWLYRSYQTYLCRLEAQI